jgi:hypothetical protein
MDLSARTPYNAVDAGFFYPPWDADVEKKHFASAYMGLLATVLQ